MIPEVINWEELDRITNCRRELAREMLSMFAAELPERKAKINAALTAQNWAELTEHIHKLHGSSAYCGTLQLRATAHDLETRLKENRLENITFFVKKINVQIDEFLEAWQNYEQC